MGWSGSYNWQKASDVRDYLRTSLQKTYTILGEASTSYGHTYYAVIAKTENGAVTLQPTMFVALISGGGRGDDKMWGYKDMDESMGPYVYDCPLRLLDKLGPAPNDWAETWRTNVRQYHARRKAGKVAVSAAKTGDKVWLNTRPEPYTVSYRYKNSLVGYRFDGAGPFRLPTKDIVKFEPAAAAGGAQ